MRLPSFQQSDAPTHRFEDALSEHGRVEALARDLQPLVKQALERLPPRVRATLHGEKLGHPLHPALIHLPLGGWIVAGILDWAPGRTDQRDHAADQALLLGTVGALPAIAAGWADWTLTQGQARRTGLVHGLINETAFVLSAGSLLARQRGHRRLGRALSGGGLVLAACGGVLGGELVYRHGVGQARG
ncbi:DUF2231 domain-containing protein [Deinococcus deserti]|uniref:DUF2231 domain-containing protein n=1 Tax=Deinococcus deserti (strain DSM 17065 / CIP 109153 / LMG 22923 / VCD115) TaxID=546414 RepID=C1CXN6_DEIDV|nr:DUF2231 domain-containing protein [Deinococcus deserti]ACO44842.1 hypothetical protein Deide_00440 [Deinococcus deserti VCD115]